MKRKTSFEEPSAASLGEMPEIDFTRTKFVRHNPYAEQIRKDGGYTVRVDGKKPYFVRVGAGRPKRGEKAVPTAVRTVRLPVALWKEYERRAKAKGTTLNAEIGATLARRRAG